MLATTWTVLHATIALIWTCAAAVAHHLLFTTAGQAAASGIIIAAAIGYGIALALRPASTKDPR
jgi:hypothetical protein